MTVSLTPGSWHELAEQMAQEPQRSYFLGLCLCWTGGAKEDAEDCLGAFIVDRLDKVIGSYMPDKGSFTAYVLQCLHNFCIDCWRREGRAVFLYAAGAEVEIPLRAVDSADEGLHMAAVLVQECLKELRAKNMGYYQAVDLYYMQGYTLEEIADMLGITMGCAKVRLHRARQELRECLKEKGVACR